MTWHKVEAVWWCDCPDIEQCRLELYVSDVRIAHRDAEAARGMYDALMRQYEYLQRVAPRLLMQGGGNQSLPLEAFGGPVHHA